MRAPINALLTLLTLSVSAPAALVSGQTVFNSDPLGIFGDWTHTFSTGPAGVQITGITISLASPLFFDTTGTGVTAPGYGLSQNVASIGGAAATGFTSFSASGAGLDGGTLLTLTFTSFDAGEAYSHQGDVDEEVCPGLGGIALAACVALNQLDGSLVNGAELAGSTIAVTLGGPMLAGGPVVLNGTFVNSGGNIATATWSGDVALVPEPGTMLLSGAALLGLGLWRRRKS
jgi:hypothetical protein